MKKPRDLAAVVGRLFQRRVVGIKPEELGDSRRRGRRRYPIKLDEYGRSARSRAFDYLEQGMRPAEVAPKVGISARTARRYYADLKKNGPCYGGRYRLFRDMVAKWEGSADRITKLSQMYGMSREAFVRAIETPYGLRRILVGKRPSRYNVLEADHLIQRLQGAMRLIDLLEMTGATLEEFAAFCTVFIHLAAEPNKAVGRL